MLLGGITLLRGSIIALFGGILATSVAAQGPLTLLEKNTVSGTIVSVQEGSLRITTEGGENLELKYQAIGAAGVPLGGAAAIVEFPATVTVRGELPVASLEKAQVVRFTTRLSRGGKFQGPVASMEVITETLPPAIELLGEPDEEGWAECRVIGHVMAARANRVALEVDRSPYSARGRLAVPVDETTRVSFSTNDLRRAMAGDRVIELQYARFSTGDLVVSAIEVERGAAVASSLVDALEQRFREFSDEPSEPRDVRSRNFVLHTDISDRQAQMLLFKLETMIDLVSRYFQRPPGGVIECYVVRELELWPAEVIQGIGRAKIAAGEGVTIYQTLGRETHSVVYSCDRHGIVQHEAMHAYCAETFGSTGPTWYAEGVAELGQYWKDGELAVLIDPVVVDYLNKSEPKKTLLEIVEAGQVTGDSWQAYAWRWALCYLLSTNPNYNGSFKQLGVNMMSGKPDSFESTYGPVAPRISFEYDQFLRHVSNGYRADLCAWQWDRRTVPLRAGRKIKSEVLAAYGWQATGIAVEANGRYRVRAEGTWKLFPEDQERSADGDATGAGRLVGVVFFDFQLSEPFELGSDQEFVVPAGGELFVRCLDEWNSIADNSGSLAATFEKLE